MKQQMLGSLLPILAIETKSLRVLCFSSFPEQRTYELPGCALAQQEAGSGFKHS
jgi:hypothetical protein